MDNTSLELSGLVWVMSGLILIPGVLWALWNLKGRRGEPQEKTGLMS
jgi:hypothetical protein